MCNVLQTLSQKSVCVHVNCVCMHECACMYLCMFVTLHVSVCVVYVCCAWVGVCTCACVRVEMGGKTLFKNGTVFFKKYLDITKYCLNLQPVKEGQGYNLPSHLVAKYINCATNMIG